MSRPKGSKTIYFSTVKEAREALAAKSLELFEQYQTLIKEAIAAQQFKVAQEGLQFLMEHLPKDEDGVRFLDPSVDNNVTGKSGPTGPTIQIGIALAPKPEQKSLPPIPKVIDVDLNE